MPIVSSDIKYKLSIKTGSAGNSLAQSDPDLSLGKYISTTEVVDATLHELFDVITGDENAASTADYRCIFVHNSHASLSLQNAVVWLSAEVAGGAVVAISVDTTAASAIGSGSAQAKEVANETTAPSSQTFTSPTTKGTGLSLGTIPSGQCKAFWIRRTAANTAALDADGVTFRVEGDTAA
jgi:hypothetical protein